MATWQSPPPRVADRRVVAWRSGPPKRPDAGASSDRRPVPPPPYPSQRGHADDGRHDARGRTSPGHAGRPCRQSRPRRSAGAHQREIGIHEADRFEKVDVRRGRASARLAATGVSRARRAADRHCAFVERRGGALTVDPTAAAPRIPALPRRHQDKSRSGARAVSMSRGRLATRRRSSSRSPTRGGALPAVVRARTGGCTADRAEQACIAIGHGCGGSAIR